MQAQRQLEQHAERAEGADHELRDVVAAHRLHDLRAAPCQDAVRLREAHAEQEIAHRPVALAQRAARLGRRDPAERARGPARRVERQDLPPAGQARGQRAGGAPGLHADGQVVGVVLEHGVEPPGVEHEIDARGRVPQLEGGAAAARDDRQALVVGERHQRRRLLDRGRRRRPAWRGAVHRRAGLVQVLGADDRAERAAKRGRRHHHHARPTCPRAASGAPAESPRRTRGARAAASPGS